MCFVVLQERRILVFEKDNIIPLNILLSWHEGMKENRQVSSDAFIPLPLNLSEGHRVIVVV